MYIYIYIERERERDVQKYIRVYSEKKKYFIPC